MCLATEAPRAHVSIYDSPSKTSGVWHWTYRELTWPTGRSYHEHPQHEPATLFGSSCACQRLPCPYEGAREGLCRRRTRAPEHRRIPRPEWVGSHRGNLLRVVSRGEPLDVRRPP